MILKTIFNKYKIYIYAALVVALVGCGVWVYFAFFKSQVDYSLPSKVENIKTMVQHNALEIEDETVFVDTIGNVGEVFYVKALVKVSYDLENLKYKMEGDTLVVELPKEKVESYELSRVLLNEYFVDKSKTRFYQKPSLTGEQLNELEAHMKQFVEQTMLNAAHIQRARENELRNLALLLQYLHSNVRVVANIEEPKVDVEPVQQSEVEAL